MDVKAGKLRKVTSQSNESSNKVSVCVARRLCGVPQASACLAASTRSRPWIHHWLSKRQIVTRFDRAAEIPYIP